MNGLLRHSASIHKGLSGLPYPTDGLDVIVYNETYEGGGTTYYKTSTGVGLDVVGQDTDGEDIINFAPLLDDRFDKGSYVGNAFGLPEYYDSPWDDYFYYDDTSEATRYHWKLKDFHYRMLEAQFNSLTNVFFGRFYYTDEALDSVGQILIYASEQTGGALTKLHGYCKIEDFQNQGNYYYTNEWTIRDMLQFVVEGSSFSLDLAGISQKVYWGENNDYDDVNSASTIAYSNTFEKSGKHLISVTDGLIRFDIGSKSLTGDIAYWNDYIRTWNNIEFFFINSNSFTGNLETWDLSGWNNIEFLYLYSNGFTGNLETWDLSGWTSIIRFYIQSNSFTGSPYSESTSINLFRCDNNDIDSSGINSILAGLETFFSTNAPIKNTNFNLASNAAPSAAGLSDKAAIEGYYTDAGFTASINVDS